MKIHNTPPPLAGGGPGEGSLLTDARTMRRAATPAERKLWQVLRNRQLGGFKFRRQMPLGPFIADFYCATARLVVEFDGISHIQSPTDASRDAWILGQGIQVLHFANADVLGNLEGVVVAIEQNIRATPPPDLGPLCGPSPQGERGSVSNHV